MILRGGAVPWGAVRGLWNALGREGLGAVPVGSLGSNWAPVDFPKDPKGAQMPTKGCRKYVVEEAAAPAAMPVQYGEVFGRVGERLGLPSPNKKL